MNLRKKMTNILAGSLLMAMPLIYSCGGSSSSEENNCNDYSEPPQVQEVRPVVFAADDFQTWWLENIQEALVKNSIDNEIPMTIGVIPFGLGEDSESGERLRERISRWNKSRFIEVAQHGYDHQELLTSLDYNAQKEKISKGLNLMCNNGVCPTSFIPPYGEADDNTISILEDYGFNTVYSPLGLGGLEKNSLLVLDNEVPLCENGESGKNCVFRSYDELKNALNQRVEEYGVAVVSYHMQDFESKTEEGVLDSEKMNKFNEYAKGLESDGYNLKTVNQFYNSSY